MADKSIGELVAATGVTQTDLFVLEQSGTAKKLTGQILENWLVSFADGHGGIQSIAKLSTSGLSDTYRITMADTTTFDFVVTNGRSITGISKTSTSGLVDTYTIEYNDGTTDTFTVQNGEKGDKGDNAYIWIKYASANPTDAAVVSMGDVPDDWMGVYTGYDPAAPSDASAYKWYRIKGDKGNTGDQGKPGETYTTSVTYGVSESPTVYPTVWYESITSAPVSSGSYVWSRVQYLNSSNVVVNTAYSVSHIGQNGTGAGTVTSVTFGDTVYQDVAGNVTIPMPSSSDVGAIADPVSKGGGQFLQWDASAEAWVAATPTGSVTTVNGVGVTAGTTNIRLTAKDIGPYHARNLLDNSDFRNPVNQRGLQEYTSNGYSIDRWIFEKQDNALLVVQRVEAGFPEDRISLQVGSGYADFYQNLENYDKMAGKRYTLAVNIKGVVYAKVFTMGSLDGGISLGNDGAVFYSTPNQHVLIRAMTAPGFNMLWMALYEGEYTAETMPEYQPKGYGAELAECIRYYRKSYDGNNIKSSTGVVSIKPANSNWLCTVNFDTPMRAVPTITLYSPATGQVGCVSDFYTDIDTETVSVTATKRNFAILLANGFNTDHSYYFNFEASADL